VKPVAEIEENARLRNAIQRQLSPERAAEIAACLRSNPERFFSAIMLGIYQGAPEWLEVGLKENLKINGLELDERQSCAFGMVRLTGVETIFAIDGQHLVEGIRAAVREDAAINDDEQTVIFVAHKTTSEGRERTRRLFSSLNDLNTRPKRRQSRPPAPGPSRSPA
jgi:DNA sulfur modification protein DndB